MSFAHGCEAARYAVSLRVLEDVATAPDNDAVTAVLEKYGCHLALDQAALDGVVAVAHCVDYQRLASLNQSGVVPD